MRLTLVASNTLRIVNPPKCERSVSVKTDHFSVLFACILPASKQETCPRGKRVCAQAKPNDLFSGIADFRLRPRRHVAQHHQLRFLLTALKLSRRIIKGMSAGALLQPNDRLKLR
jgi:hypothetical protein